MKHLMDQVAAFHKTAGRKVETKPGLPPVWDFKLAVRLVQDEFTQLCDVAAMAAQTADAGGKPSEHVLAALAHELGDLLYVTAGLGHLCGLPMDDVMEELQRANIEKCEGATQYDVDGKVIKPEKWRPPDILSLIQK